MQLATSRTLRPLSLTDYETWMPDFMSGLAKGIKKSKGMVASAMNGVAADMVVSPKISAPDTSGILGGASAGDTIAGITTAITEAGTVQHDVVHAGVVTIGVSFSVSAVWLKQLTAYSKQPKIAVQYFDTEDLALKETEMYITGYKAKLYKDTSYKSLWTVSFTLKEF